MSGIEQTIRELIGKEAKQILKEMYKPVIEMFPDLPLIATAPELAKALRASDNVLRHMAQSGGLPHSHIGRELRFNKAMIIEWIVKSRKYVCEICAEKNSGKETIPANTKNVSLS